MNIRTIPVALEQAAIARPTQGFTFVRDDGSESTLTFPQVNRRAKEIAAALQERSVRKGDRIAIILPAAEEFVPTFLGIMEAGAVPVPLYPPMGLGQLGTYLEHSQHILLASRSKFVITTNQVKAVLGKLREAAHELLGMLTYAELQGDEKHCKPHELTPADLAFIQFTSGSTSAPKGVVVSHENLCINTTLIMRDGLKAQPDDRGLSWLPLYHDMGLIGFVIAPIFEPTPVSFMNPLAFVRRPAMWLNLLSRHRGTITYAPNFAYALAVKRVKDEDIKGIDLSCVRHAGCGAEPIHPDTLRAFAKRYKDYGFREEAFVPSYGMAENTLAISFSRGIPTDRVKSDVLWGEGRADVSTDEDGSVEIVGCGGAFEGHQIKIVDPETRADLPERRVGEIVIHGPSVTAGYFENAEKTAEVITPDGWLSTGDLGYLVGKQVFICGRKKDVIIVNGRNYYPQDIEWAASRVDGVRAGNVIAFPSFHEGLDREAVVVVAESKQPDGHDRIAQEIKGAVAAVVGVSIDEVVIVEAGTVPKTSSGKLQRSKGRALYEQGALKKREENKVQVAKRVLESGLAHLRLSIFGNKKRS